MEFNTILYLLPLVFSCIISLSISFYLYTRKKLRIVKIFTILMFCIFLWSFSAILELTSNTIVASLFWTKIMYIGIVFIPVLLVFTVIEYIGKYELINKWSIFLLSLIPVICLLSLWTNSYHNLFYESNILENIGDTFLTTLSTGRGVFFWVFTYYSYFLIIMACCILINKLFESEKIYLKQVLLLLISILIPFLGNTLFIFSGIFPSRYDITPSLLSITGIILAWNIFHFKFLNIIPAAKDFILERTNDYFFIIDNDYRIVFHNNRARELFDKKDVIGKDAEKVFSKISEKIKKNLRKEKSINKEIKIGDEYFLIRIETISKNSRILGKLLQLVNITERKELEKNKEINKIRNDFMMRISHELKRPLVPILGYSSDMLSEVSSKTHKKELKKIVSNAKLLKNLIEKILTFTSLKKEEFDLEETNIKELINKVLNEYKEKIKSKDLELIKKFESSPKLMIDDKKIKKAFNNIIENSVKNTEKGFIKIILKEDEDNAIIIVEDTGKGISEEVLQKIRKGSYIARLEPEKIHTGIGVGLVIVKNIVEAHNGEFNLKSERGKGTRVCLYLPK